MSNNNKLFAYKFRNWYFPLLVFITIPTVSWYFFGYYISRFLLNIELIVMGLIFSIYNFIYSIFEGDLTNPEFIRVLQNNPADYYLGVKLYNLNYAIKEYTSFYLSGQALRIADFISVFWFFNKYLFIFYGLFGVGILWYGFNRMNGHLFTEKLTMDTLIEREKHLYPELHPVVGQGLISTYGNINDIWAPPLNEYEFAERHDLLLQGVSNQFIDEHGNVFQNLNSAKAREVFDNQLDNRMYGFENMPPHRQVIYALIGVMLNPSSDKISYKELCIKQARKVSRAFATTGEKGNTFDVNNPDMYGEWVEQFHDLFKDLDYYKKHILSRYAYELTAFAALYSAALNIQGVMPTSYFKWLKIVDRELYFVLNNVGRQNTYFVEVAGIMVHWNIEADSGMPHIVKKTKNAVTALEVELRKYTTNEERTAHYFRRR